MTYTYEVVEDSVFNLGDDLEAGNLFWEAGGEYHPIKTEVHLCNEIANEVHIYRAVKATVVYVPVQVDSIFDLAEDFLNGDLYYKSNTDNTFYRISYDPVMVYNYSNKNVFKIQYN